MDESFAVSAKKAGKVTSLSPKGLVVTYEDGTTKAVSLGRRFGKAAGLVLPHEMATELKEGQSFKAGDILSYNALYFQPDILTPGQVVWKAGVLVTTAILESPDTLEDSSVISAETAKLLETQITYVRDIVVGFKQTIHDLVQEGESVEIDSILCMIEDAVTAENHLFDDQSVDLLRLLSANAPRAKHKGIVEKVEVYYHGDLDDMSPSLAEIANASDRERKRAARALQAKALTGKVDASTRIQSKPLTADNLLIRVYITSDVAASAGDKGVFANQMKSVFGRVMSGVNETASGIPLGAIFSYTSISNRIVRSPELIGVSSTLLKLISQRVVKAYKG